MVNTELLEQAIEESGYKKSFLAKRTGLSRAGFCNCVNNRAEFKLSQIVELCRLLKLTTERRNAIFFASFGA